MSILTLESLKQSLRVTHSADDALLQNLLDGAEAEAKRFTNRLELPGVVYSLPDADTLETVIADEPSVSPDVRTAVWLLVSARYDSRTADEAQGLRHAAETLLQPYRTMMGA